MLAPNDADVPMPPLHGEAFSGTLSAREWIVRQRKSRRSHLLVLESRRGTATVRGMPVAFEAPAMLWLPADAEGSLQVEAGAQGYLISMSDDLLTRIVASSAEALYLRRTVDRFLLLNDWDNNDTFQAAVESCRTLVRELYAPQRGAMTMMASHVLLLCLQLWRSAMAEDEEGESGVRGDGPRLVGNFLQMVELHYRDGWPVARYAATLGVTDDKLHAHCKREKGRSPRALIHGRLVQEACTRLLQLDLPVEQIGYGLGFRDPAYFNRFFRKYKNMSPGHYRRHVRQEQARDPSYAAWP